MVNVGGIIVREVARKAIQEAGKKAISEVGKAAKDALNETQKEWLSRCKDSFDDVLQQSNKQLLNNLRGDVPESPIARAAFLQRTMDSNFKGQLGEAIGEAQHAVDGCIVESQVDVGPNRLDSVMDTTRNLKYTRLTSENGLLRKMPEYVRDNTRIAMEYKNGSLGYLATELKGKLPGQIKAGLTVAEKSFVGLNNDCINEMFVNPHKAHTIINEIEKHGGVVIAALPSYAEQLQFFLNS